MSTWLPRRLASLHIQLPSSLHVFYLPINHDVTLAGGELFLGASNEVPTNGGNLGATLTGRKLQLPEAYKINDFCAGQAPVRSKTLS